MRQTRNYWMFLKKITTIIPIAVQIPVQVPKGVRMYFYFYFCFQRSDRMGKRQKRMDNKVNDDALYDRQVLAQFKVAEFIENGCRC